MGQVCIWMSSGQGQGYSNKKVNAWMVCIRLIKKQSCFPLIFVSLFFIFIIYILIATRHCWTHIMSYRITVGCTWCNVGCGVGPRQYSPLPTLIHGISPRSSLHTKHWRCSWEILTEAKCTSITRSLPPSSQDFWCLDATTVSTNR